MGYRNLVAQITIWKNQQLNVRELKITPTLHMNNKKV